MRNIYRFLLAILVIFIIGFFAIKPYNNFCNLKEICKPIYWRNIFPKEEGEIKANIIFKALNYHENLEFKVVKPDLITTFSNKVNIVEFEVKNLSQKLINFRPELIIEPIQFARYIDKYQCLCMQNYSLKSGEAKTLKMVFSLKSEIYKNEEFSKYYSINDIAKSQVKEIKIMYAIPNSY